MLRAIALLLILSLAGCAIIEPEPGEVSLTAHPDGFSVRNGTNKRIYHMLTTRENMARALWEPHFDEERSIAPGQEERIARIVYEGDGFGHEYVFLWWSAIRKQGQLLPGRGGEFVLEVPEGQWLRIPPQEGLGVSL